MSIEFHPVTGHVGAEVTGIDLGKANSQESFGELRDGLSKYGVLFFRDQDMSPEDMVAFGKGFGNLFINDGKTVPKFPGCEGLEELRREPDQKAIVGGDWHADQTYREDICEITSLYAVEVPDFGGDTVFINTAAVYAHLPEALKRTIKDLRAVHSHAQIIRKGMENIGIFNPRDPRIVNDTGEWTHPVVRRHSENGRDCLFISPGYTERFEGWTREQSLPLLSTLFEFAVLPDFQCRMRWRPGSLAMWDNRQTWHYASSDYFGKRRVMRRMMVKMDPAQSQVAAA